MTRISELEAENESLREEIERTYLEDTKLDAEIARICIEEMVGKMYTQNSLSKSAIFDVFLKGTGWTKTP